MNDEQAKPAALKGFLEQHHPFDLLPDDALTGLAAVAEQASFAAGHVFFEPGDRAGLVVLVLEGLIDVISPEGQPIARLGPGMGAGERAAIEDQPVTAKAVALEPGRAALLPAEPLRRLAAEHPDFAAYYRRPRLSTPPRSAATALGEAADAPVTAELRGVMTPEPVTVRADVSAREAASVMRHHRISCVLVTEDGTPGTRLTGVLTAGDLTGRVLAQGRPPEALVAEVMTPEPFGLPPGALVLDALLAMSGRGVGHLPVVEGGKAVGVVTKTDLTRRRHGSVAGMVMGIGRATEVEEMAAVVDGVPTLLAELMGAGTEAHKAARMITAVTDAVTVRLLTLAEARLGPPPVPYLWLACGSQGRREQSGTSDQDNCLILDDSFDSAAHGGYFEALARQVCDGLDACGYVHCPGEMMAITPKWRQPVAVWRGYFRKWIDKPDPMAQMLASVMFDLRPIHGRFALFAGLQRETLDHARANSIFRAHLIANSLKHQPPLTLFRGFALVKSGEGKSKVDLKHGGVVPITDLARVYALDAGVEAVNTRERLLAAREAGSLSRTGADDLIDAYDFIAEARLKHQARQVRAGEKPDNFLSPNALSALERKHLRDAFSVVKSMQSALGARSAA